MKVKKESKGGEVKHELQVASFEFICTSYEFKFTSCEFKSSKHTS